MQELKKRKNNSLKIDSFADSSKIFMRYLVILFLGLFNLFIIYFIFTPITVNSIYFILNLFYKSQLSQETIIIYPFDSETPFQIDLIPSCIAGAAYYFLIILNLSTPMNLRQR
ncbi:MAG: pacearchaeosortase, partial [Candidatus Pacearchaeota archaeon]